MNNPADWFKKISLPIGNAVYMFKRSDRHLVAPKDALFIRTRDGACVHATPSADPEDGACYCQAPDVAYNHHSNVFVFSRYDYTKGTEYWYVCPDTGVATRSETTDPKTYNFHMDTSGAIACDACCQTNILIDGRSLPYSFKRDERYCRVPVRFFTMGVMGIVTHPSKLVLLRFDQEPRERRAKKRVHYGK
jgi:hypothetical protein